MPAFSRSVRGWHPPAAPPRSPSRRNSGRATIVSLEHAGSRSEMASRSQADCRQGGDDDQVGGGGRGRRGKADLHDDHQCPGGEACQSP